MKQVLQRAFWVCHETHWLHGYACRHNANMIKIIWLAATVYFMTRLVKKVVTSMKEINAEEQDAGNAVVDVEAK
ncbi:hypothetical protein [Synechococcus sp. MIT S9503]|uniref:hypothetical protein n=1 Tax=Synechococcus sp. MIT S9503 TaxID=3082547 RepID=UPI0039A52AFF